MAAGVLWVVGGPVRENRRLVLQGVFGHVEIIDGETGDVLTNTGDSRCVLLLLRHGVSTKQCN